jgi:hypothetical protein
MLNKKAILMTLSLSSFSPRKTDKRVTSQVLNQHAAASDAGKFVKNLLPDEAIEPIKKLDGEIRQFHYDNTVPWGDDGLRLLPILRYDPYMEKMRQNRAARETLVQKFLENYQRWVENAPARLSGLFNPGDYPPRDVAAKKFQFKLQCQPVPDAGDFRVDVPNEELDALRRSVDERVAEAAKLAHQDLCRRLAEPLAAMVERLSQPDAIFRDTLVGNLREIVALIPALNLTGDPQLEAVRQRVLAELAHYTPEQLRANKDDREAAAAKAQAILEQMNGFMSGTDAMPQAA